jgi:hypothetical protein
MAPAHLRLRGVRLLALLLTCLLLASCGPEADRARGGGPGADTGNRHLGSPALEIHGQIDPSYDTPRQGQGIAEEESR